MTSKDLLKSFYRTVRMFHFLNLYKQLYFDLKENISNVCIAFILIHSLITFGPFLLRFSYPSYVKFIVLASVSQINDSVLAEHRTTLVACEYFRLHLLINKL